MSTLNECLLLSEWPSFFCKKSSLVVAGTVWWKRSLMGTSVKVVDGTLLSFGDCCFLSNDKLRQKSGLLPVLEMHRADATWSRICSAIALFFITSKGTMKAFYITLLLPLTCGSYPAVCCCQLLNNSQHGFCNTFHAASPDTNLQLKPSVVLGLFSKADLILGWI